MKLTMLQEQELKAWESIEQREKVMNYVTFTWNMNAFSRDDLKMIALELLRRTIEE